MSFFNKINDFMCFPQPHILVECVDLKDVRNKHFVASSIKDLFDNIEAHKIIVLMCR